MSDVGFVIPGGGFSAGVSTGGNTAGATGITGTNVVLVGGSNISLSQTTGASGATVTINAPVTPVLSYFAPIPFLNTVTNGLGVTRPMFQPFVLPVAASMNSVMMWLSIAYTSANNTSTASGGMTFHVGLYKANADSLSLLVSGNSAYIWTNTGGANIASMTDMRFVTVSLSHTSIMTPGNYWFGIMSDTESGGVGTMQHSLVGLLDGVGFPRGPFFVASSNRYHVQPGLGRYTAATAALPSAPSFVQITNDASAHRSQVYWHGLGSTYTP